MQDYGFYIKREKQNSREEHHNRSGEPSVSNSITDLPGKSPEKAPKDLPSPRHRPGEPILYDPPRNGAETFPITFPESQREQHLP